MPEEHVNLCDSCVFEFANCHPCEVEFGSGIGCDNVIKCDIHESE